MGEHQTPPLVYTPSQISQFLDHIGLPTRFHKRKPSISLLRALHTHFISTFPYENLAIHYNPGHSVSLDPQVLFEKAVTRKAGRGGYCMENALLFYHVLRGLGFDVYTVGARTRERDAGGTPGGEFPGWVHIVNIVTLPPTSPSPAPQRYHVDIAFGGDGALYPLPLIPNLIHQNLGNQQIRLLHTWIPTQTHRVESSKIWIYQYRNLPHAISNGSSSEATTPERETQARNVGCDEGWNSYYCFSPETEFMPMDWEVVNYWTSTSTRSLQTHRPLCILFLRRTLTLRERHERGVKLRQERQRLREIQQERQATVMESGQFSGTGDDSEQSGQGSDNGQRTEQEEENDLEDFYIYGKRMLLAGTVKENLGGRTKVVEVCETEAQRVNALEKWFGITLTAEEKEGIRGFRSELRG